MRSLLVFFLLAACITALPVNEMEKEGVNDIEEDSAEEYDDDISTDVAEYSPQESPSELGHWYGTTKVAFSAYLSSSKRLGGGQHIKFDKVLLNDGDGYEAATGVFRPKVDGVFMFTYVIAQRNRHEIRAKLVYNGKTINGAVAEGRHSTHDVQGTNTAIIHVCKGKPVWIEAVSCSRIEGHSENYRFTSFSGFLLYARR